MESQTAAPVLLLTVLLLGLVHGIDWDHIAAISDITGTVSERRLGLWLGSMYAAGHAFMNLALGALAILVGIALPEWMDRFMEPVVGLTLIFLAGWIAYSLFQSGDAFQLRSRWMLVFDGLRAMAVWTAGQVRGEPQPFQIRTASTYGTRTAFSIGMIHGIGAETATQALLFLAVAGLGGKVLGTLMLTTFVMGLFISNSAITVASIHGFQAARGSSTALRIVGGFVAVFSLVLGLLFLTGQGTMLPLILGWEPSL